MEDNGGRRDTHRFVRAAALHRVSPSGFAFRPPESGGSVGKVERWHLPSIEASGTREPRVLFSQPEFRGVVIDLNHGDELGDHRLYEHSVLQVVSGGSG